MLNKNSKKIFEIIQQTKFNTSGKKRTTDNFYMWSFLSTITSVLLFITTFCYNWLNNTIETSNFIFLKDSFPWIKKRRSLWYFNFEDYIFAKEKYIITFGPVAGCLDTRYEYDFFTLDCYFYTENFFKLGKLINFELFFCELMLILGATFFTFTTFAFCCRCFDKKTIGLYQAISGAFYSIGIIVFLANLGSKISKHFCGTFSEPFEFGNCRIGPGLVLAIIANFSMFICSLICFKSSESTKRKHHKNLVTI